MKLKHYLIDLINTFLCTNNSITIKLPLCHSLVRSVLYWAFTEAKINS